MPPAWVAQGLADVLGLDLDTINAVIVPDLEGYASEARLRAHLADFLGTAPAARAFTDRYVAYRFPPLAPTPAPAPAPAPVPAVSAPPLVAPAPVHASSSSHAGSDLKSHIRSDLGIKKKKRSTAAAAVAASLAQAEERAYARGSASATLPEALESAFGPGGKVYQKSREDDFAPRPSRGGSARGAVRTPVSGAHTPTTPTRPLTPRAAGAVTITESTRMCDRAERQPRDDKIWDLPRSDAVKRLDAVVDALRAVQAGEKGAAVASVTAPPCFCQARMHELSRYTPQCGACGLILCELQPAHAPCPSCARPTLSPPALARLILRVEGDINAQFAREQDERDAAERARKERLLAESGGGAFPTLAGKGKQPAATAADAARRVLTIKSDPSLAGKGRAGRGKATLTTTTYAPAPAAGSSSSQAAEADAPPETIPRPRSPPLDARRRAKETNRAREWAAENDRPWGDRLAQHHGDAWDYVETLVLDLPGEEGTGRRRKAKAKKGLGVDGRVVVGAAQ